MTSLVGNDVVTIVMQEWEKQFDEGYTRCVLGARCPPTERLRSAISSHDARLHHLRSRRAVKRQAAITRSPISRRSIRFRLGTRTAVGS